MKNKEQESIREIIRDTALAVKQSTEIESKALLMDVKRRLENVYTKDELNLHLDQIHEKLDALIAQTTKTNGRVTTLERWMSTSKGAVSVLTLFIVPILLYLIYIHIGK